MTIYRLVGCGIGSIPLQGHAFYDLSRRLRNPSHNCEQIMGAPMLLLVPCRPLLTTIDPRQLLRLGRYSSACYSNHPKARDRRGRLCLKSCSSVARSCYSPSTTELQTRQGKHMNKVTLVALTSLVMSAVSFAQTNHQVGAWSIYTTTGKLAGNNMVLLQTTASVAGQTSNGPSRAVKLDVVCKNNRVFAIAVEPGSKIDKHLVSYESPVPTVHLRFDSIGMIEVSENWAVTAGGRSVTPYSQFSQGSLNREWVDRLSGTESMVLYPEGRAGDSLPQSTFNTRELTAALDAVGCTE